MNIEFTVTKTLLPDTLRFELVHHRGEALLFRKVYRLAGEQIGKIMGIKSGDQLSFLYKHGGRTGQKNVCDRLYTQSDLKDSRRSRQQNRRKL